MPSRTLLLEAGTDGGKKKPIQEYAGIDQSLANASQLGKGLGTKLVRALVELLFNDPEVTKIQTDPSPSNLRAIDATRKRGLRGKVPRNHPRWSSRVHGSNTPGIRANTQCCSTLPSRGTSKGWRPWPPLMSNVKHHEGSGDRRSIDSTIRGSWRHPSAISNRRCWPYICTAPQWMAA